MSLFAAASSQDSAPLGSLLDCLCYDYLTDIDQWTLSQCSHRLYYALLPYRVRDVRFNLFGVQSFAELLRRNPFCAEFCLKLSIDTYSVYGKTGLYTRDPILFGKPLCSMSEALKYIFTTLSEHSSLQSFSWKVPHLKIDDASLAKASMDIWNAFAKLRQTIRELHLYIWESLSSLGVLDFLVPLAKYSYTSLSKFTLEGILHDVPDAFFANLLKAVENVSDLRINIQTIYHIDRRLLTLHNELPHLRTLYICFLFPQLGTDVQFTSTLASVEHLSMSSINLLNVAHNGFVKSLTLLDTVAINSHIGSSLDISFYFPSLRRLQVPVTGWCFSRNFFEGSISGLRRLLCIRLDLTINDFSMRYDQNLVLFLNDLPSLVEISLKFNACGIYTLRDLELLLFGISGKICLLAVHITCNYGMYLFPSIYRFKSGYRLPNNLRYVMFTMWPSLTRQKTLYRLERDVEGAYLINTGLQCLPSRVRTMRATRYGSSIVPMKTTYWEDNDIFDHSSESQDYGLQCTF